MTMSLIRLIFFLSTTWAFAPSHRAYNNVLERSCYSSGMSQLMSSFYDDFEDFEDFKDDEDDDDVIEFDASAIAKFRSQLGGGSGGATESSSDSFQDEFDFEDDEDDEDEYENFVGDTSKFASISSVDDLVSKAATEKPVTDWASPVDVTGMDNALKGGVVLVANPAKFCDDFETSNSPRQKPNSSLLTKFGLTVPPPTELGPDRRADLLPVLLLLDRHSSGAQSVLLNRRTGYLIGDLEQQQNQDGSSSLGAQLGAFMIQPLWFGGTSPGSEPKEGSDGGSVKGLDMIHVCPTVEGAVPLTDDGLFWGGDPAQAQDAMNDPSLDRIMSGFDFKFFVQSTRWLPKQVRTSSRCCNARSAIRH